MSTCLPRVAARALLRAAAGVAVSAAALAQDAPPPGEAVADEAESAVQPPAAVSVARQVPVSAVAPSPRDPLENYNRTMFALNERLDMAILKPVAEGYRNIVPELARSGVSNFLGNLGDAWSTVNQLLQGKLEQGTRMFMRLSFNTVFGLGGLLDISTEMGLDRRSEDFGQTLGHWGVPPGPYLVLPILGPSTLRDAAALPLDLKASSATLVVASGNYRQTGAAGLQFINLRASALSATNLLEQVALDKYTFVREGYFQRRRNQIFDGDPPPEEPQDNQPPPASEPNSTAPPALDPAQH